VYYPTVYSPKKASFHHLLSSLLSPFIALSNPIRPKKFPKD
jgi:hypothetical protein